MKHQCHNVLLLMGNIETIAAIKQSLLLEPASTKPVLDSVFCYHHPKPCNRPNAIMPLYSSSSVGVPNIGVRPVMVY